jgi:hypothetical protein
MMDEITYRAIALREEQLAIEQKSQFQTVLRKSETHLQHARSFQNTLEAEKALRGEIVRLSRSKEGTTPNFRAELEYWKNARKECGRSEEKLKTIKDELDYSRRILGKSDARLQLLRDKKMQLSQLRISIRRAHQEADVMEQAAGSKCIQHIREDNPDYFPDSETTRMAKQPVHLQTHPSRFAEEYSECRGTERDAPLDGPVTAPPNRSPFQNSLRSTLPISKPASPALNQQHSAPQPEVIEPKIRFHCPTVSGRHATAELQPKGNSGISLSLWAHTKDAQVLHGEKRRIRDAVSTQSGLPLSIQILGRGALYV